VRVTVVLHLAHEKVWVSTPLSLGTALGTTRVSRIGLLQIGHFGASVVGSTGEIMGPGFPKNNEGDELSSSLRAV
jgi:hypothetical protein